MWPRKPGSKGSVRRALAPPALALALAGCCHAPKQAPLPGAVTVDSRSHYTAVATVTAGRVYRLSAQGRWVDWFICTDAGGFASWPLMASSEGRRRLPEAKWFALVGLITADGQAPAHDAAGRTPLFSLTPYLDGSPWTAPADGTLQVFANDLPDRYGNNRGAIRVALEPWAPPPAGLAPGPDPGAACRAPDA